MMDNDDQSVGSIIDTARYLRNVRPLDPAEMVEYVSESEAQIRTILREHAVSLAIRERDDGRFVPAADDPPTPEMAGIDRLPASIERRVSELLVAEFGVDWYHGESGDALRETIRSFKSAYFAGDRVEYDRTAALGYTIYHLPGTFAKIQYALATLGNAGLLPPTLRVLEVGPGVGGSALGLAAYLQPGRPIAYRGIEPSDAAADICEQLLDESDPNIHWEVDRMPIESAALDGTYDLIVVANALNEMQAPGKVIIRLASVLADNGSIVAISPADERTSRSLRATEREAVTAHDTLDVYAPTMRLWPDRQPQDRCWSFDVRDPLVAPSFQRKLDEGRRRHDSARDPATGEFVNVAVQYAYSILRTDGQRRIAFRPSRSRFAPLDETDDHVGERMHLAVVKLSHSLSEEEAHPLYVIGDGSQRTEHFAVHTRNTSLNRALEAADYGAVLLIENGLVLWNADESAYNVIVDGETVVDAIPSAAVER